MHASCLVIPQSYMSAVTSDLWQRAIAVNVFGYFSIVSAAIPILRPSGGCSIACIRSSAVQRFARRDGLSSVPKSALEELTRAMAKEE